MKKLLYLLTISALFFNCSSDDDNNGDTPSNNNYFPINAENTWSYSGTASSTSSFNGTNVISGNTYNKLLHPENVFGFIGDYVNVRKEGNNYYLSGNLDLNGEIITAENQKFMNDGATVGETINESTFVRVMAPTPVNISYFNGTATNTVAYKTVVKLDSKSASATFGGHSYSDVAKVIWTFYIKVDTQIQGNLLAFGQVIPLDSQTHHLVNETSLGTLTQNFANHIGVAHTVMNLDGSDVQFNNSAVVALPASVGGGTITVDISPFTASIQQQINDYQYSSEYNLGTYNVVNP